MSPAIPLAADLLAFVTGGVSIGVASRDAALNPHVVRALGLRVDGPRLVVLVPVEQARDVLDDVAANAGVALVCSQPSTHRTCQLKGVDARIVPLAGGDRALAFAYRDALARDLGSVGYAPAFCAALLDGIDGELLGIAFTPEAAFTGTPGPQAGQPLERAP